MMSVTDRPRTIAILQSNYIPWKGYFDLIGAVDEFILLDDVQYTRQDWRNRNRIKTPQGPRWITIPVFGHFGQTIRETKISDPEWGRSHWERLRQCYGHAEHFRHFAPVFEELYLGIKETSLSAVNRCFIEKICECLGISTRVSSSADYRLEEDRMERLVSLCRQTGAARYLTGPAARAYVDENLFREAGIKVLWADYSGYPEYQQVHPPFEHGVTILDLLFNTGPDAPKFMKSFQDRESMGK